MPLANPYICAHHDVLSESLMTNPFFMGGYNLLKSSPAFQGKSSHISQSGLITNINGWGGKKGRDEKEASVWGNFVKWNLFCLPCSCKNKNIPKVCNILQNSFWYLDILFKEQTISLEKLTDGLFIWVSSVQCCHHWDEVLRTEWNPLITLACVVRCGERKHNAKCLCISAT